MIRTTLLLLAVSLTVAAAGGSEPADPLDTVRIAAYSRTSGFHSNVRVLNWNIDRGSHLAGIEDAMRQTKPDLCIFQEVDLGARRTHGEDVARELASAFEMNFAFAPEFQELSQSTSAGPAFHGQAVLTTFPIRSSRILRFKNQSGFWKPNPLMVSKLPVFQRRAGGRIAQVAELDNGGRLLVVYNLHLESKGDDELRGRQMDEVLADAERYSPDTPIIIAGDFNTFGGARSRVIHRLIQAGYTSCLGRRSQRTHVLIGAIDWVFIKGPLHSDNGRILRDTHASDHFPLAVQVNF
ncbi:MAG TPA: endonuclease/exonuclease/phosphatase family protein [Bryobacteraceae bacterium]|nr:endonuclease/exonuclease/phosphatase family protein [Bryobacteraceae bacterium]